MVTGARLEIKVYRSWSWFTRLVSIILVFCSKVYWYSNTSTDDVVEALKPC